MKHFTSDPHIGHDKVIEMSVRRFSNIEEHDNTLIENINTNVDRTDELWILGDLGFKNIARFRNRIRCKRVYLIWGNHDKKSWANLFTHARDTQVVKVNGQHCFLSHYAHAYWPGSHRNHFHLYGHNHDQREYTLDTIFPGRRSMDVGVDTAFRLLGSYRPFSEIEIFEILGQRPGHDHVDFYLDYQANRKAGNLYG